MEPEDELTGLLPRVNFLEKLDQFLAQIASRQSTLTLVFVDIDNLRPYNEQYGHVAGDNLIRQVGNSLATAFGPEALAGRYGGDEFLAAVPGQPADVMFDLAEKLRLAIDHSQLEVLAEGQVIQTHSTISLGLATYPADANEINDLIEKAKQALFRAKGYGGNTICFYEEKDGLTGVFNHYGILRKLDQVCTNAAAQKEQASIIMLDIDRFLELNNQFGHRTGDEVLKRLASILQANFKDGAQIGRYTGDEFMVVLPDCRAEFGFCPGGGGPQAGRRYRTGDDHRRAQTGGDIPHFRRDRHFPDRRQRAGGPAAQGWRSSLPRQAPGPEPRLPARQLADGDQDQPLHPDPAGAFDCPGEIPGQERGVPFARGPG